MTVADPSLAQLARQALLHLSRRLGVGREILVGMETAEGRRVAAEEGDRLGIARARIRRTSVLKIPWVMPR